MKYESRLLFVRMNRPAPRLRLGRTVSVQCLRGCSIVCTIVTGSRPVVLLQTYIFDPNRPEDLIQIQFGTILVNIKKKSQ